MFPSELEPFHFNMETVLRSKLQNLIVFKKRQELLDYKADGKRNILVVCCKTPEDTLQLRKLTNFHTFSLIGLACEFHPDVIASIRESCRRELGFRFGDVMRYSSDEISFFMQQASQGRSLYFCHRDIGLINRANLTFDYFFRRSLEYSPNSFFEWAKLTQ
jgi:hypothetical protein